MAVRAAIAACASAARSSGERLADDRADVPRGDLGQRELGQALAILQGEGVVDDADDRDLLLFGLVRLDQREVAAGRAVGQEPATLGGDLERGPTDLPAGPSNITSTPAPPVASRTSSVQSGLE